VCDDGSDYDDGGNKKDHGGDDGGNGDDNIKVISGRDVCNVGVINDVGEGEA
jgi:hypothetical protein